MSRRKSHISSSLVVLRGNESIDGFVGVACAGGVACVGGVAYVGGVACVGGVGVACIGGIACVFVGGDACVGGVACVCGCYVYRCCARVCMCRPCCVCMCSRPCCVCMCVGRVACVCVSPVWFMPLVYTLWPLMMYLRNGIMSSLISWLRQ